MKVMKKVMKSTPAKGKPTSGNRNQTLAKGKKTSAKGKPTSAKGKPTSAKGKPLKNGAAQAGILKKTTCKSWGSRPFKTKSKKRGKQ